MDTRKILFGCTLLFSIILELWVRAGDNWGVWSHIDSVMHFFWGLNIALFLLIIGGWSARDAFLAVLVWQFWWEFIEIVGDRVVEQTSAMLDHLFFDGLKDTLVDALGALLAISLLKLWPKREGVVIRGRAWMSTYLLLQIPMIVIGSIIKFTGSPSPDLFAAIWIAAALPASLLLLRFIRRTTQQLTPPSAGDS